MRNNFTRASLRWIHLVITDSNHIRFVHFLLTSQHTHSLTQHVTSYEGRP